MRLSDFKVLTFDCYGTLIDWEQGILEGLAPLTSQLGPCFSADEALEAHAALEARQQLQTPTKRYRELLALVYRRLAEQWSLHATWEDCARYGNSIKDWPVFPDTVAALQYLQQHYKLVILSNIDNESFAQTNQSLGISFDAVYTAEDIGHYKPADANFAYMLAMLEGLGFGKADILHVAESLFHDHVPANRHGLRSCWIHRRHDRDGFGATARPEHLPQYDFRFTSMAELAAAHQSTSAAR